MNLEDLAGSAIPKWFRAMFLARRMGARMGFSKGDRELPEHPEAPVAIKDGVGRNILFITVDQQRFDALGTNGGLVAKTPHLDQIAQRGLNYHRAHVQNVVCMPSRATMLSGLYPMTHGVVANGIQVPRSTPSVAEHLRRAGYRTALIGKAHFDPHLDLTLRHYENRSAAAGKPKVWHGFEHTEFAAHGPVGGHHYAAWLWDNHPRDADGFAAVLTGAGGGDTGGPEITHNPMPVERYHTAWVAQRTINWLDGLDTDQRWFCWMSFPDPHHPFDPPYEEVKKRVRWRDLDLPATYLSSKEAVKSLARRPQHWLDWYEGRFRNPEGGPTQFVPGKMTPDMVREINAMIHVENELIDDACGRVFRWLEEKGLRDRTDIIFTSDHGELQGDYGLMFKGPYHVDSLLRVPLIWKRATHDDSLVIKAPVGHIDLAPTFCQIAGLRVPTWMQGNPLPQDTDAPAHERVITTFDSQFAAVGMHLRTIFRDGYTCTVYEPSTRNQGGQFPIYWRLWGRETTVPKFFGHEGELYDSNADPHQYDNLWSDPARQSLKKDLIDDLYRNLPRPKLPPLHPTAPT